MRACVHAWNVIDLEKEGILPLATPGTVVSFAHKIFPPCVGAYLPFNTHFRDPPPARGSPPLPGSLPPAQYFQRRLCPLPWVMSSNAYSHAFLTRAREATVRVLDPDLGSMALEPSANYTGIPFFPEHSPWTAPFTSFQLAQSRGSMSAQLN